MSDPPKDTRSDGRVTLPPIRDLFRDEFMHSSPGPRGSPSFTLARLRVSDDGDETSLLGSNISAPGGHHHIHRSTSDESSPPPQTSTYDRGHWLSDAPPHGSNYQESGPSSTSGFRSHTLSPPRWAGPTPTRGPPDSPSPNFNPYPSIQPQERRQNLPASASPIHDQHPRPDGTPSSYPGSRERFQYNSIAQMHYLPTPPDLTPSARARTPDSPPALVQAVAPWVVATNLEVGQVYEDDERTFIARPFDTSPAARSTSHPVPTGRFLDDGLQTPLGKYDCKFCGKLFNRPSSLRIHLNSHTGEKPFICPHENCGRSFSVLSNMRRHARVHMMNPREQEPEESTDEASRQSSPTVPSMPEPSAVTQHTAPGQTLPRSQTPNRRGSRASASSSGSRQSPSRSSQDYQMGGS